jgi:tRNA-dihydrouridine synthase A
MGVIDLAARPVKFGYQAGRNAGPELLARMKRAEKDQMAEKSRENPKFSPWRFCVAPMMEWTDRHCRYLHRLLSRRALLYSEMLTTGAVLHGDCSRLLRFDPAEQPVALQLGGSDPAALARSAAIGEEFGYCEINLNAGCPSDRVQEGRFGACLMAEPELVAQCVVAMKAAVKVPVTVKCRIGIDEQDPEQSLFGFAAAVKAAGADALIVHARKAWLKGLSPRENREVPPLNYKIVHRLKAAHPDWPIVINGGIGSLDMAKEQLEHVDGVMMGRAAYQEPWRLLDAGPQLFGEPAPISSAKDIALAFVPYIERELARGTRLHAMTRHMLGLFHAVPGARAFRRHLSTHAVRPGAGTEVLIDALSHVADAATPVDSQVKLPHIAA